MAAVTVEFSGPLFDGTAERLLEAGADAAELEAAKQVQDAVRQNLRAQARDRTGFYESRVVIDQAVSDLTVTDNGLVYGPWLEGTGRRNQRSTFKGYRLWRRGHAEVDPQAVKIAEQALGPFINRMG